MRKLVLRRGDVSQCIADSIATSANRYLVGNASPNHWRFNGRKSADGAIRAAGGPELEALANAALVTTKTGALDPGDALVTPSAGNLITSCRHVIHAVAPDGLYGGQDPSANEALLHKTFASILSAAEQMGSSSVACPALGCGVQGFRPAVSARAALAVANIWLQSGTLSSVRTLTFVIRAEDVWRSWLLVAEKQLGSPHETETHEDARIRMLSWAAGRFR